jgi:hypothetical protein
VQEFSPLENQHVVRARHAHAWTLAWVDGHWKDVDTTPAIWAAEEADAASALQPLYDLGSWLNYRFALWRSREQADSRPNVRWLWLIAPMCMYLAWRVYRRQRIRLAQSAADRTSPEPAICDPRLALVLDQLARMGFTRPAAVPLLRWATQLELSDPTTRRLFEEAVRSYYRARFDPQKAHFEKPDELTEMVRTLITSLQESERRQAP